LLKEPLYQNGAIVLRMGWLLLMALSGWTAGEIVGAKRPGHIGDVMLGIVEGSFVVLSFDILGIHLQEVNLVLLSIWGAAALPCLIGILIRHRDRTALRNRWPLPKEPDNLLPVSGSDQNNTQRAA
jgi:uncharacterized membrane protein YeaQ/YmgE (transglycosylase-associated protein family)